MLYTPGFYLCLSGISGRILIDLGNLCLSVSIYLSIYLSVYTVDIVYANIFQIPLKLYTLYSSTTMHILHCGLNLNM